MLLELINDRILVEICMDYHHVNSMMTSTCFKLNHVLHREWGMNDLGNKQAWFFDKAGLVLSKRQDI